MCFLYHYFNYNNLFIFLYLIFRVLFNKFDEDFINLRIKCHVDDDLSFSIYVSTLVLIMIFLPQ